MKQAYELAKDSPGTIVTDMPVYKPEAIGLEEGTKVLLFNDGSVTGRCAAARRIASEPGVDTNALDLKVMGRYIRYQMVHTVPCTGIHWSGSGIYG